MIEKIKKEIKDLLKKAGVTGEIELSTPPNPEMGDFAFGCFGIAKKEGKKPNEVAEEIKSKVKSEKSKVIDKVDSAGPYVNFFLNSSEVAKLVLEGIEKQGEKYGTHTIGKKKKVLIEFGCPNPLKVFHLGHLKNLITGESVVRIFENVGYDVLRVNYQGDVGMHVAKALWGFEDLGLKVENLELKSLKEKVEALGRAYAHGAKAFEEDKKAKKEILEYNEKIYERDDSIQEVYKTTRQWSLDYFDTIYKKLGSRYDHMYFESETYERGLELVNEFLKKEIFKKSEGAIIFEGSKYDLHDRVFINSKGYPTYEAKELALAEKRYDEYHPEKIIHVVGKEQAEYFKVVFKALEEVVPESKGRGCHLVGGYLQLKGQKKMSSRSGNVISGDDLLDSVGERVREIMKDSELKGKEGVVTKVTNSVLKYAMLKSDVSKDVAFDLEESISTSGDSGPYLQYIVARIKSIIRKAEIKNTKLKIQNSIEPEEKELILKLAEYPEVTKLSFENYDPSKIAHYLFDLAQSFNRFYNEIPVLKSEVQEKIFRLHLISAVEQVMVRGLYLLGIEIVEEM